MNRSLQQQTSVSDIYVRAWRLGLRSLTLFNDNYFGECLSSEIAKYPPPVYGQARDMMYTP